MGRISLAWDSGCWNHLKHREESRPEKIILHIDRRMTFRIGMQEFSFSGYYREHMYHPLLRVGRSYETSATRGAPFHQADHGWWPGCARVNPACSDRCSRQLCDAGTDEFCEEEKLQMWWALHGAVRALVRLCLRRKATPVSPLSRL